MDVDQKFKINFEVLAVFECAPIGQVFILAAQGPRREPKSYPMQMLEVRGERFRPRLEMAARTLLLHCERSSNELAAGRCKPIEHFAGQM